MDKKILNKFSSLIFYLSILLFVISFNFAHNPPSGWYQQFLPNLNGASITDITFIDSLTGYAVTNSPAYILKTTNGGDNWNIKFTNTNSFVRIEFINANTGFTNAFQTLFKTTNSGENWNAINLPGDLFGEDMFVLNEDTIWLVNTNGLVGGVFRTTNGGTNWQQQLALGSQNPDKIYMFDARIGFVAKNTSNAYVRKTTNGGLNWFTVINEGFTDMYFIDSLTGWKCWNELDSIKKTTNGGISWIKLLLPPTGGFYNLSTIRKFSFINKDTIWGVGARASTLLGFRGLIYKSTNGGDTWGYQLPDTNIINIGRYFHIDFINKLNGWAYANSSTGVHTVTGGDSNTIYTGVNPINNSKPVNFILHQNYPNPFNPNTIINYTIGAGELRIMNFVKIKVYNVLGNEVKTLVDKKQNAGDYKIEFNGSDLSSGIYFYSLIVDGIIVDTKKMLLVK